MSTDPFRADSPDSHDPADEVAATSSSDCMRVHEQHRLVTHRIWLGCLAVGTTIGLIDPLWLWITVAVAGTRGALLALSWGRVAAMRQRTRRTGRIRVPAAVHRAHVYRTPPVVAPPWHDHVVDGSLEATDRGWTWHPHWSACGTLTRLVMDRSTVTAVRCSPRRDPWMPPAQFVQVRLRDGRVVDLVVWDQTRLPALVATR